MHNMDAEFLNCVKVLERLAAVSEQGLASKLLENELNQRLVGLREDTLFNFRELIENLRHYVNTAPMMAHILQVELPVPAITFDETADTPAQVVWPPPPTPTERVIADYRANANPWSSLRDVIREHSPRWDEDAQAPIKAYIFACISEIVYQQMSKYELPGRSRYKIIPSLALQKLVGDGIELDLRSICALVGDFNVTVVETRSFLFGAFQMGPFNIIAVRGTTPILQDLLIDLDDRLIKINGLGFHAGFYNEAKIALPDLLTSIYNPQLPLYFTGHSLGGAVAGILPMVWPDAWKKMTPYLFAAPRYSNKDVAAKQKVYSYARSKDPVPHLPMERSGFASAGLTHTMVPPTDKWIDGPQILWRFKIAAHSIEQYRFLLAQQVVSKQFAPTVYYEALERSLTLL
jgi:hypothetical protein